MVRLNLCALRERARLTKSDVAARCGVSVAAYAKWENGAAYPMVERLPQLARVFGVRINDLFLPADDEPIIPA